MAKTKPIKKKNHRIFAIAFSTLIIIALLAIVPLTLMSLNTKTDERSQAFTNGTVPADSDRKWFYISTPGKYPFAAPATFTWESETITPPTNTNLRFISSALPVSIPDNGFEVQMICKDDKPNTDKDCLNPTGQNIPSGYTKYNHKITQLAFELSRTQTNKYTYHGRSVKFTEPTKVSTKIVAAPGVEAYIDTAAIEKLSDNRWVSLIPNSNFKEFSSKEVLRKIPKLTSTDASSGLFVLPGQMTENDYYGNVNVGSYTNIENDVVGGRSLGSDKTADNSVLKYEYRFKPTSVGLQKVRITHRLLKMNPNKEGINFSVRKASNGELGSRTACNTLKRTTQGEFFEQLACAVDVKTLDSKYFYITITQGPGQEYEIDKIEAFADNWDPIPNSKIETFLSEELLFNVKYPAKWSANYDTPVARWTARGEY